MGAILKQIQYAVRDFGPPEVGTSLRRAHTGRVSDSFSREEQACELLVNEWLDAEDDDPSHCGRLLVKELIDERPRCLAPVTYRARRFPDTFRPTDPKAFGPSPSPRAGRYNRVGQNALYLGASSGGLSAEMSRFAMPGRHYFYARYLPIDAKRLVDLSDPNAHPALHLAFDRAERLDLDYEAAQRMSDVVRELNIDGIIVPGVRGSAEHHYANIVLFNCRDWADWVDIQFSPKPLLL